MYPDHRQEGADGAKRGLSWWDARNILRKIQGIDGHIQGGENTVPPLRSLGSRIHGQKSGQL